MTRATSTRRYLRRARTWSVALAWGVHLSLLAGLVVWLMADPRVAHAIPVLFSHVEAIAAGENDSLAVSKSLAPALATLRASLIAAAGSLLLMLAGFWLGGRRARGLRSWLLYTTIVSAWLGLYLTWPTLAWQGQQWRLGAQITNIDDFAAKIDAHWPPLDDQVPELGAFISYPLDTPSTLLLLRHVRFPGTDLEFSAVERTPDGALRFELTGHERGVWLEWRPDTSPPGPFQNGVETYYQVQQAGQLSPHWYLVRYVPSS